MNMHTDTTAAAVSASEATVALALHANAVAKAQQANVKVFADALTELMAEIHGGKWRADIDHSVNTSLVLIRPDKESPIQKPKRGEVA